MTPFSWVRGVRAPLCVVCMFVGKGTLPMCTHDAIIMLLLHALWDCARHVGRQLALLIPLILAPCGPAGTLLGTGAYGRVYRGRWLGREVAVKVLQHNVVHAQRVAQECDLTIGSTHPNVLTSLHYVTWRHFSPARSSSSASAGAACVVRACWLRGGTAGHNETASSHLLRHACMLPQCVWQVCLSAASSDASLTCRVASALRAVLRHLCRILRPCCMKWRWWCMTRMLQMRTCRMQWMGRRGEPGRLL